MDKEIKKEEAQSQPQRLPMLPQRLADEIARMVVSRIGSISRNRKNSRNVKIKSMDNAIFLDTSAIIDARFFDVVKMGLFRDTFIVLNDVLLELKHIADSQDMVRRERGRKGLEMLDQLKKVRGIKVLVVPSGQIEQKKKPARNAVAGATAGGEVDEILIATAKKHKGRVITCDYNLEKKASIQGITAINVHALANSLKVIAVPGEALHIKLQHPGKDATQGVGYLDDGTMIVVENGVTEIGKTIDIVVSRVIQTSSGRILFAKKI